MPVILFLLIAMPIVEIAVFIEVGGEIGLLATLALVFATALLGTWLLRQQGLATLDRARREMDQGRPPVREMLDGICIILAGCLLLTPGFVTDSFGFLLLAPASRRAIAGRLVKYLMARGSFHMSSSQRTTHTYGQKGGFHDRNGDVIDGEFDVVDPDDAGGDVTPAEEKKRLS